MRPSYAHLSPYSFVEPFLARLRGLPTRGRVEALAALFPFVSCPFVLFRFFFRGDCIDNSEHAGRGGRGVDRLESEKFKNRALLRRIKFRK